MERVRESGRAVVRGYQLNKNEQIIRQVINEVMCNYYVNFKEIAQSFNASLDEVYSAFNFRITSYNVCYTKLLRSSRKLIFTSKRGVEYFLEQFKPSYNFV